MAACFGCFQQMTPLGFYIAGDAVQIPAWFYTPAAELQSRELCDGFLVTCRLSKLCFCLYILVWSYASFVWKEPIVVGYDVVFRRNCFHLQVIMLTFRPWRWSSTFLKNIAIYLPNYTTSRIPENRSQMNKKRKTRDIRTWKNIYFSTYPPPTLIHLPHRFTSASKPAEQKSFWLLSQSLRTL
jgi:hypothetical protein